MPVVWRLDLTKNLSLSHAPDFHHGLLGILRLRLGDDHPLVARILLYLAELLIETGDVTAAESAAREALQIYKEKLPAGHPSIAGAESVLAECLGKPE